MLRAAHVNLISFSEYRFVITLSINVVAGCIKNFTCGKSFSYVPVHGLISYFMYHWMMMVICLYYHTESWISSSFYRFKCLWNHSALNMSYNYYEAGSLSTRSSFYSWLPVCFIICVINIIYTRIICDCECATWKISNLKKE